MAALTTIALVAGAAAAVGGTAYQVVNAEKQKSEAKKVATAANQRQLALEKETADREAFEAEEAKKVQSIATGRDKARERLRAEGGAKNSRNIYGGGADDGATSGRKTLLGS